MILSLIFLTNAKYPKICSHCFYTSYHMDLIRRCDFLKGSSYSLSVIGNNAVHYESPSNNIITADNTIHYVFKFK